MMSASAMLGSDNNGTEMVQVTVTLI